MTAEEAEDADDADEESGGEATEALGQAAEQAAGVLDRLQEGPKFSLGFAEFPVRILVAVGLFIAVFMAAWMLLWAVGGGAGLALGWLLAMAVGALAVKLYADRSSKAEGEGFEPSSRP